MPRKNYRNSGARRRNVVEYVPAEIRADYAVTLTNGSGVTTITVTGTQAHAWNWAVHAGANGGIKPGSWHPVNIKSLGENSEAFAVV